MSGNDVKDLQIVLNADPATQVAMRGSGSKGQESSYFGTLTEAALEKFQLKYAPEVLFPAGIWQPTGVAGTYTRAKLGTLSASIGDANSASSTFIAPLYLPQATSAALLPSSVAADVPPVPPAPASTSVSALRVTPTMYIFNLSRYQARHGDTIVVQGGGFLPTGNSIVFSSSSEIDGIASDGKTLSFVVPASLPNGSYNLFVNNVNGSTFDASFGNFFMVTDTPSDPPAISSITPTTVAYGSSATLTITGSHFASTGNTIYSGLGTLTNIASPDGKTLTVTIQSFPRYAIAGMYKSILQAGGISVPIYVAVKNTAGISSTTATFLLRYTY